jgi:hypothetical protein
MNLRVVLSILVVTFPTAAVGQENATNLVANARSLKLDYWKWAPSNTVSHWDVRFSGDEIRTLGKLLARATPYDPERSNPYVTSFRGEFRTDRQAFIISIGEQKEASRPVLIVLRDANTPKSALMYRLLDDDARMFNSYLHRALEARTRNVKPDRVVQH